MNSMLPIDATQWVGAVSFGAACAACWRASRLRPDPWRALAWLHFAVAADVVLGTRYLLHDAANAALRALGGYPGRAGLQLGLLALMVTAIVLFAGRVGWRRAPASPARLAPDPTAAATFATAAAVGVFDIEIDSLHAVDAAMYARLGPFKAIALLWAAPAACVVAAAVRSTRGRENDLPIGTNRR